MNPLKFLVYWSIGAILLWSIIGYQWYKFLKEPFISQGVSVSYEFEPKMSIYHFVEGLHHLGVLSLKKRNFFVLLVYVRGDVHRLKTGEYLLQGGVTPDEVLKKLVNGDVIQRHITFLEGWNFKQVLAAIQANHYLQHTLSGLTNSQIMHQLGHSGVFPEGRFFPDTYFFTYGASDKLILERAYGLMQKKLEDAWDHRSVEAHYKTSYEALIAASILEKESGFKAERPMIAGVLLNRIHRGIPLQIDSTVSYGLGGTAHLTQTDLTTLTPYNTYRKKGWPPTPIAMPSLNAIEAALHPQHHAFIYFVAKGTVGHHFSETLKEHHVAVLHYRLQIRKFNVTVMPDLLSRVFAISPSYFAIPLVPYRYGQHGT